jgi:hypothetical protein
MQNNWNMSCPNCGSLKKKLTGLGSMHMSGYDEDGYTSSYSHTCGKCNTHFEKIYHYGKELVIIKCDGKIISEEKDGIFKLIKDNLKRIKESK